MKNLIRKILKEYEEYEHIQKVNFDGFSDPVLIPQFQKYLVKFNGTSREEKIPESEKIVFKDNKTNKEYIFNADDVQKSGSSPFYINLDVLRRYYHIEFKDDFVRHKENLSSKEYWDKMREVIHDYMSDGRCKTYKCKELRDVIEISLKEMYGKDYGDYISSECEPTKGFLNIYPIEGTFDDRGNQWSKLNYVLFRPSVATTLIIAYLKKYGTFEHKDFIKWVNEDKERLFRGPFLDLMFKNINLPQPEKILGDGLFKYIKKVFPNSKIINSFCPNTSKTYSETITVSNNGRKLIFQPIVSKSRYVLKRGNKFFLVFGRRGGAPLINRNADYIITNTGSIFKNENIITGDRAWEFKNPPIYTKWDYDEEYKRKTKLR